jgi:hypothetical protein
VAQPPGLLALWLGGLEERSGDDFIGWNAAKKANLSFLTNNMRVLILPWVRVPHLASHIVGRIARRIRSDWLKEYGHQFPFIAYLFPNPSNVMSYNCSVYDGSG